MEKKMHTNATDMQIETKQMKMSSLPEIFLSFMHMAHTNKHVHKHTNETNKQKHHKKKFLVKNATLKHFLHKLSLLFLFFARGEPTNVAWHYHFTIAFAAVACYIPF